MAVAAMQGVEPPAHPFDATPSSFRRESHVAGAEASCRIAGILYAPI